MADETTARQLSDLTTEYLRFIESMVAQHRVLDVNQMEFIRQVVGYGDRLAEIIPGLSEPQWQALAELSASHLSQIRLRAVPFRNGGLRG